MMNKVTWVAAIVAALSMGACGVDPQDDDEIVDSHAQEVVGDWGTADRATQVETEGVMGSCDDVCAAAGFSGVLGGPAYWCAASTGDCQCVQPRQLRCVPGDHAVILPR